MAGSGNWSRWFSDQLAYKLYGTIYPKRTALSDLDTQEQGRISEWEKPGFVKVENGFVRPQVPVFSDFDVEELSEWFADATAEATQIVSDRRTEYRALSATLSDGGKIPEQSCSHNPYLWPHT